MAERRRGGGIKGKAISAGVGAGATLAVVLYLMGSGKLGGAGGGQALIPNNAGAQQQTAAPAEAAETRLDIVVEENTISLNGAETTLAGLSEAIRAAENPVVTLTDKVAVKAAFEEVEDLLAENKLAYTLIGA